MTISESLILINSYPIPTDFIEKVGINRGLVVSDEYTLAVSKSEEYRLATADVYFWLYGQITFKEQEVSFAQQEAIKQGFLDFANDIYKELDPDKYTGKGEFGFAGDEW